MDIALFINSKIRFFRFALTLHIDSSTTVKATLYQQRLSFSHSPEHNARFADAQRLIQIIGTFSNQDGSSFLRFHRRNIVDGRLQILCLIYIHDVLHIWNRLFRCPITTSGIVHRYIQLRFRLGSSPNHTGHHGHIKE